MNFSSRLSLLIGQRGVTQRHVASECNLSPAALNQYLQGRTPKADELLRLARFFCVTMEWFLTGDAPESTEATSPTEIAQEWRDRARDAEAKVELLKSGMLGLLKKV